ncbi:hypothetical protein LCGC14_0473890 [marine sediment metagenome]|uniref:Uncharacterized protein n=1 Tax=marine sediment metagenome TaxID=412755 RepID=A0A0F9SGK0_9ZZZZ|nr:hypothetical protein [bacterium]
MKKVIKKASYSLHCPKCIEMYILEDIEEIRESPEISRLVCICGYTFPNIEKNSYCGIFL